MHRVYSAEKGTGSMVSDHGQKGPDHGVGVDPSLLNFGPLEIFRGFCRRIFVGKSAQKNPPGESPAKSSKIDTTKSPTLSGTDMTGRPGYRTVDLNGGSYVSHLSPTPRRPLVLYFV